MSVLSLPAFAAGYGIGDSAEIDVFGTAVYFSEDNVHVSEDKGDGSYSVKADGGVKVTVNSPEQKGLLLVVRIVDHTDKGAYEWFLEGADKYGTKPAVFDIYFIDSDGNRVEPAKKAKVDVALNEAYSRLKLYSVDKDGTFTELDLQVKGATITFEVSREGYYVFLEGKPDPSQPPQTGDVNILLFVSIALTSAIIMVLVTGRKKNQN